MMHFFKWQKQQATAIGADPTRENVYTPAYLGEALRWYDRWLKGVGNGIDAEPPVHIFVHNEGWRAEESWPLAREVPARFHLDAAGALARQAGDPGSDDYTADFTHDASFGPPLDASQISVANAMKGRPPFNAPSFGHSRQQMFGVPGDLPYRTDKAEQVLTYTSAPLEADTEVTGTRSSALRYPPPPTTGTSTSTWKTSIRRAMRSW